MSVTRAQFARDTGIHKSRVTRLVQSGVLPTDADGNLPVPDAYTAFEQHVLSDDHGDDQDTLVALRCRKLRAEAEQKELELQRQRGELVDRERAENLTHDLARQVSEAWQTWPSRVAPELAARLQCDPQTVERVLSEEVRKHLANMSASLKGQTQAE